MHADAHQAAQHKERFVGYSTVQATKRLSSLHCSLAACVLLMDFFVSKFSSALLENADCGTEAALSVDGVGTTICLLRENMLQISTCMGSRTKPTCKQQCFCPFFKLVFTRHG